jgi:hypothetical protein
MFFASNISSKAQPIEISPKSPCTSSKSWPNVAWKLYPDTPGHPGYMAINCGGCWYLFEWYYRQVAIIRLEVQITQIIKLGISSTPCTPGCSFDEIKRLGYLKIWEHIFNDEDYIQKYNLNPETDPALVAVQESQCHFISTIDAVWKIDKNLVLQSSMFEASPFVTPVGNFYHINVDLLYSSCDTICCRMNYNLDWDVGNIINVEWDEVYGYGYIEQEECPSPPTNCENSCDGLRWNWNPEDGFTFGPNQKPIIQIYDSNIKEITISPNPNDGNFSIKFENKTMGEVVIQVFNIYGESVYLERFVKENNNFYKDLKLKGFVTGTYILEINQEGKKINKKFIITE